MKYLLAVLLMFSLHNISAQGFGNPYDNRLSGRGRSAVPRGPSTQVNNTEEKIDPAVLSLDRASVYEELLQIDVFTKEVLRSYLENYYTSLLKIQDDEKMIMDEKRKAAASEQKKFEELLSNLLSQEQVTLLIADEESGRTQKQVDKKKKEERKKKRRKKGK